MNGGSSRYGRFLGGPWGGQFRSFFWWLKRGNGRQKVGVELMYLMKKG